MADEYTDYQLEMTDVEVNNAFKLINKMEKGTASIKVPPNIRGMYNQTVHFGKSHKNPKIFLQLNIGSGAPTPALTMQPIATYIHDTFFYITLVAANSPDISNIKEIPSGTYKVDYLIIDG